MTPIIHSCGCSKPASVFDLDGLSAEKRRPDLSVPVIDLHAHVLCPEVDQIAMRNPLWTSVSEEQAKAQGEASLRYNLKQFADIEPRMTNAGLRIKDMTAMGVDIQVLSPSPTQYYPWVEEAVSARMVALQNQQIVTLCEQNPAHFLGLAAVSQRYPALAAQQLEEAMKHPAIKGAELSSRAGPIELADPTMDEFWAAAERLGAVIFLHPLGTTLGTRAAVHYLTNVIGQPLETTIALSGIIFSGVLDRFPGLKICAAHGGGYLPLYIGRSDHAWHVRPESQGCRLPPSDYLRHLWFDSLVYRPDALRFLIDRVGLDRIVLGTDYPFDMGAYELEKSFAQTFRRDELEAMLGLNARKLLNLQPDRGPAPGDSQPF